MRSTLLLLTLTLPLAGQMTSQGTTGVVSLVSLRDRARPLLIFAPKPNDPRLLIQLRRLNGKAAAVTDRDIVVIAVPCNSPSPTQAVLTESDAQAARHRFHIAPPDFAVILIGKDGGEKLRSSTPLTIDKLRDTIDAMPMRKEEMRSKPHV